MQPPANPSPGDLAVRLLAVARALDVDGQYNAAKLFRAAALSETVRASRAHPRADPDRERAATATVADLRAARGEDALVTALERTLAALRTGQPWVTLDDAPRAFVCRDCGEVMLGEAPAACPTCAARPLTFREVLATYFLEPISVEAVPTTLAAALADVERLCSGLDDQPAPPGTWPPAEIVLHLIVAEELLRGRAERIVTEEEPFLASIAPPVGDPAAQPARLPDLLARYRAGREQTLTWLRELDPAQWERTGFHPEWGRITTRQQVSYLARHEQSHLADLEASCRAMRE